MLRPIALVLALLLSGCGSENKPVGGVSAEEAAQLNNAAEMLDASADDLTASINDADRGTANNQ